MGILQKLPSFSEDWLSPEKGLLSTNKQLFPLSLAPRLTPWSLPRHTTPPQ
jgi:hypothetical protein